MIQPTPFPQTKGMRIDFSTCFLRNGLRIGLSHIQYEAFTNKTSHNYQPMQPASILQEYFLIRIVKHYL